MRGIGRDLELIADARCAGDKVSEAVAVVGGEAEGRGLFIEPERGDVQVVLREHGESPQMLDPWGDRGESRLNLCSQPRAFIVACCGAGRKETGKGGHARGEAFFSFSSGHLV